MWMDMIALYRFDDTIFDNLNLPEALEDEKDTIIDNILLETAEREVIYPDASFMKDAIGRWSAKEVNVWAELYATTQYEYNPIWNKDGVRIEDRHLKGTDYRTDDHSTTRTHTDTITRTHTDTVTTTHGLTVTTDDSIYGYNSSTAAPESKEVAAQSGTTSDAHTGSITDAHTGSITDKDTGTIKHDTSDTGKVTYTEQGNIGVTSTQSLILEQRDVVKFNILDVIIQDFSNRFILKVY